jgi:hypothetical protein
MASECYTLQEALEINEFQQLMMGGDVASRIHPVVVTKLNCPVLFLKQAFLYRFGAMIIGAIPSIHLSCQNMTFSPFPNFMLVEA